MQTTFNRGTTGSWGDRQGEGDDELHDQVM